MGTILIPLIHTLNSGFRTRAVLLAEIMALRHQLAILKQSREGRPPDQDSRGSELSADIHSYRWQSQCHGLYQIPVAA
jgi:hypothetical protein